MRTRLSGRRAAGLAALVIAVAACANPPTPSPGSSSSAVTAIVSPSPPPSADAAASLTDSPLPSDSPAPSLSASPSPSLSPSPSPSPSPTPAPFHGRPTATRVVVPALGIDLPVVAAPRGYPYCDVAMYFGAPFGQPGQSRVTYLFAHARVGMFYPIYSLTMLARTPNRMVGMKVLVYTSDSELHTYRITRVLPHQLTLNAAAAVRADQVWLQTSEGPHGTPGKTQVETTLVSVTPASYAAAHPTAQIVRCGY